MKQPLGTIFLSFAALAGLGTVASTFIEKPHTPQPRIEYGPAEVSHSVRERTITRHVNEHMVIEFTRIDPPMTYTDASGDSILVEGLTYWWRTDDGKVHCKIFGPIPEYVNDDPDMDTLGHEFLHCISGEFHAD